MNSATLLLYMHMHFSTPQLAALYIGTVGCLLATVPVCTYKSLTKITAWPLTVSCSYLTLT